MAKEYRIPAVWQMMGFYYVEADSLKDALAKLADVVDSKSGTECD